MTDNNKFENTFENISNRLDINIDNKNEDEEDNKYEEDNKSVNSNISNSSNKLIIDNISNSIKDIFTQNILNNKEPITNNEPIITKEPITTLNNAISSWDSLNTNITNNVTFSIEDVNEIKSIGKLNNSNNSNNINNNNNNNIDNLNSINSGSEVSYTAIANKQLQLDSSNILKHIRGNKKKSKNKDDNNLDEIDYLYNKLQDYIRYMEINRYNYILIIVKAMEIIDSNENDIDKKNIVTKALNRIILIDLNLSDFDQTLVLSSLNNIIEIIIICSKVNNSNKYSNKYNKHINKHINEHQDDIFVLASSGQIIHSLIDKITTIVIKKQYNADKLFVNICTITDILMILVNKYNYINSIEKKTIVIQAFTIFINQKLEYIIDLPKDKKQNLILALDSIPFIIDLFIALQNGKYKINRKIIKMDEKQKSFIKRLFCFSKNNDN